MNEELKLWLEKEFYYSNHPKYRKYFQEWFNNLLPHQLEGFYKQMIGMKTKSKVQH